jgi:hypothetical protein
MTWLLNHFSAQKEERRKEEAYKELLRYEARLGGHLFGPIPDGVRREFFCLDPNTWVWHEEWKDKVGRHTVTTRYDVRPSGILKSQGNNAYQRLSAPEAQNFIQAVRLYRDRVGGEMRRLMQEAQALR